LGRLENCGGCRWWMMSIHCQDTGLVKDQTEEHMCVHWPLQLLFEIC
jgi:hypothetical protein